MLMYFLRKLSFGPEPEVSSDLKTEVWRHFNPDVGGPAVAQRSSKISFPGRRMRLMAESF